MTTIQTPASAQPLSRAAGPMDILDQLSTWHVLIPNRDEVAAYLTKFSDVAGVLPALCADLRCTLGSDVELSLEIYHDRESIDEYLALFARKDHYQAGFIQQIDAVNRRFDDLLEQTIGYLAVTTDFHRRKGAHGV